MRRSLISAALAGVLTAVLTAVLPTAPASANVASIASIGFTGTASLYQFPCPSSCYGDLYGGWVGHAAGEWNSGAFDVSWENIGGLSAWFSYSEFSCADAASSALGGTAHGTGRAEAGPGQIRGNWQGYGELPRDITNARLTFSFDWIRTGTEALISFSDPALDLYIAGFGWQNVSRDALPTTATFVPTPGTGTTQLPTCSQPTQMRGQVVGTVEMTVPGV
jgi:hypothetical protein